MSLEARFARSARYELLLSICQTYFYIHFFFVPCTTGQHKQLPPQLRRQQLPQLPGLLQEDHSEIEVENVTIV